MTKEQAVPQGPLGFIVDKDKILDTLDNFTSYIMEVTCKECGHMFLTHSFSSQCCRCKSVSINYCNLIEWTCPVCKTISLGSKMQSCSECKIVTSECSGYCKVDPETPAQR